MTDQFRKVKRYLDIVREKIRLSTRAVEGITTCPCGYKSGNTPPPADRFVPFTQGGRWGTGKDSHAWFHFTLPPVGENCHLHAATDRSGWDADNPQFLCYINGKMRQGMDTNHTEVLLTPGVENDVYLYGYVGPKIDSVLFFAEVWEIDTEAEGLYYDLLFPWQALDTLSRESTEYALILDSLYRAVSLLDLEEPGSEDFRASVKRAREFMKTEFYEGICRPQYDTTVGIGHTHIDCAWKWTLRQTREKVQRSFSTVLELMKRYPEYKFMSSQALLYKDLKEEAPEVYEEVRERIREGRWECEGAMWVEADCNLSSGESLVRQVLYGKNFFKKEFGVENRVLWLPDVFGYSAALPQILRKSGVEWFVTSKISWNDTDRMPYDTFLWKGIDGTEINSYFLTAQTANRDETYRHTTYVAHTNAQMIAGTVKRYGHKNLNTEALITFGFGDGGGGPTTHHLELLRRGASGVPGIPNTKIDFAGDFLKRLEKKIDGNPALPRWQGELYLEFHRGTYTTMSRNKRNNRKSEILYQEAELYSSVAKALTGRKFPADELHHGWEMILTNQFHDIIPGSSIQEVYEQSDIDYAEILGTGTRLLDGAKSAIASAIAKNAGTVIFQPTSFGGRTRVNVNGKTVYAGGVVPKGYTCVKEFVTDNHVKANKTARTVETDRYLVKFDKAWQMTSLYDKKAAREVLTAGAVGNELRVYPDYPDTYDAWEWQIYSRDTYKPLTALQSVDLVEDGVRLGVRLVRPYRTSVIRQIIWFTDDEEKIEFETVADWHEHHLMLKAAFPVDINAEKATYEIQFGSVERPTHFNTSWDQAKFEVCAHKYADLSEGGYGISIINDCKYGHDIHDGVIQLSLLRSPTDPNPEADQGEIPFTYALCPHEGTLAESDTLRMAYELNDPATAVAACGEKSTIPENFSAAGTHCRNVLCDTVKQAEDGKGTILRFFECKNIRTKAHITLGIPARHAYLCDLMENELSSIPVKDGAIDVDFGGFEIVTVKLK